MRKVIDRYKKKAASEKFRKASSFRLVDMPLVRGAPVRLNGGPRLESPTVST